jgi:hypothetical protein
MNEQFVQAINYTFLWHKETAFVLQRQMTPIGQVTSHLAIMSLPADSNELTLFSSAGYIRATAASGCEWKRPNKSIIRRPEHSAVFVNTNASACCWVNF